MTAASSTEFGHPTLGELSIDRSAAQATLRVTPDAPEFLLVPTLIRGVGSYRLSLDRGQPGPVRHVKWHRAGNSLLLLQLNLRYFASDGEGSAPRDSFAQSTLFRTPILSEDASGVVIDVTALATRDFLNFHDRISADHGPAFLDPELCWLSAAESFQHPAGIELTAFLTLSGAREDALRVAPDATAITITQRLTLMPLPESPMTPRRYHVSSGGYGKRFADLSLPQNHSQESGWQPRFRLERVDSAIPSRVKTPIVFSVDPEIPQPWLDAILEGGNWWQEGFERAGFVDAYRVEVRDPDSDPAQAGVNSIWWVHRADRGPSLGAGLTDPRSGEILKGNVRLGAQRLQQLTQLGEALLSPYGRTDEAQRIAAIDSMVVARVRHLAAHEIAHALGFMHNFASHLSAKPSVTDYPFPAVSLDQAGEVDLSHTYSTGISEWDIYLVRSAYEQFAPSDERTQLSALRQSIFAEGHMYLSDDDGNALSSSHPAATPWVFGSDALATLEIILQVRAKAIADFSRGAVPPDSQAGELEKRFALVHLLHRYQAAAVAKLIGGVSYGYGDALDPATAPVTVASELQHQALESVVALLKASVTAVPEHVIDLIAPPSIRYERTSADFVGHFGPIFDPLSASAAAAAVVCQHLFEPSRLNRMSAQHARDSRSPSPTEAVTKAFNAVGFASAPELPVEGQVIETVRSVIIQYLIEALRSEKLHASCLLEVHRVVTDCADRFDVETANEVKLLLADGTRSTPWAAAFIPDGWPL